MKNLRPLHDRVLVERIEEEDKTKGGSSSPT
jgi:co-chaperonin GroES (HSP10)